MNVDNTALAEIIDRQEANPDWDQLLAVLIDHGVFVPLDANHSLIFVPDDNDGDKPVLVAFTSEQTCREKFAGSLPMHCNGIRLEQIRGKSGVAQIAVLSPAEHWVRFPMTLISRTLQERGLRTVSVQTVHLARADDPEAIRLRDTLARRIREFPGIETVWIAHSTWAETDSEILLLHIALTDGVDPQVTKELLGAVLGEATGGKYRLPIATRVLRPADDAEIIAELNTKGLDTVRADHATGRVEVVSVDYDDPR